jgi:hypothetical protein
VAQGLLLSDDKGWHLSPGFREEEKTMKKSINLALVILFLLGAAGSAQGFIMTIGDNDGYGYAIDDGASLPMSSDTHTWVFENRGGDENVATDGAQFTDFEPYAARNLNFSLLFTPTADSVTTFWIDYSGIQSSVFGRPTLLLDGVDFTYVLNLEQGAWGSDVTSIFLDPTLVDLSDGMLNVQFQGGMYDHIAFDYFALESVLSDDIPGGSFGEIPGGETPAPTPEPTSLILLGSGLVGLAYLRKRFS